ncbi:hypothetical protein F5Y17DRAFT_433588 [Xylariaceae sp. FL0594]|nr:hypothetical protein F5Y17DRAFT_433588 [Xylariaceae sp. FL0594]
MIGGPGEKEDNGPIISVPRCFLFFSIRYLSLAYVCESSLRPRSLSLLGGVWPRLLCCLPLVTFLIGH